MTKRKTENVTMRVRIADRELEVTGPKDFVEKKIDDFVNIQRSSFEQSRSYSSSSSSSSTSSSQASSMKAKKVSTGQFFRKISAKSDVDRVLAAGYYFETFKNEDSFTAADIRETIREAKIRPPKNPNESINKNIKKGFMMPAGDKDGKREVGMTKEAREILNRLRSEKALMAA